MSSAPAHILVDEVRPDLIDVLEQRYSVKMRRDGREYRGRCPVHRGDNRSSLAVSRDRRLWRCYSCGEVGDVFTMLALLEGCTEAEAIKREAARVGYEATRPPTEAELAERRRRREAEQADRERAKLQEQCEAADRAAKKWAALPTCSEVGEAYLRSRGLGEAVAAGLVRFDRDWPAIALHDSRGAVVNIVRRRPGDGDPKILGERSATTKGTFGRFGDIGRTTGAIVLVEGFADWLTASIAHRRQLVLGAHGAGRLALIAGGIAPHIVERGLVLVPHRDPAGLKACDEAAAAAIERGLPANRVEWIDVSPCNDLNDWHQRGAR